jgi:tetraacyldisaccharide 4'-kinase
LSRFDRDGYLKLVRGEHRGLPASLARAMLGMSALGYQLAVNVRNAAFDRGWFRSTKATIPVISVGNITLGGTGKTPMVEWIARWFRERGLRVVIVSRGYGGSEGLNDEGRVLEENLPDVPHLQGADRVRLAQVAVDELESEVIVLDDGFQHRRLVRDLDVVLLDALEPFGLGRLFPSGLLREPLRSLRRAGVVVLSRADLVDAERRSAIRAEAERHAGPLVWVEARHAPLCLIDVDCRTSTLDQLAGARVVAFCGIGNPEGLRRTLAPLCPNLVDLRIFPDHHPYSAGDVDSLRLWASNFRADLVLTTQKDLVKLRSARLGSIPLRALKIGLEIMEGSSRLESALEQYGSSPRGLETS